MIPCSIDGGFSLFKALTNIVNKRSDTCYEILQTLSNEGITSEYFSLSNWVCLNACTMDYHQDKDASYSMICVPYINYEKSPVYNDNKGSYAFSFCWDNSVSDEAKISFFLETGVGIYFLGPSCNHRQDMIEEGVLINLSSYQNSRLYSNLKCSINRCLSSDVI